MVLHDVSVQRDSRFHIYCSIIIEMPKDGYEMDIWALLESLDELKELINKSWLEQWIIEYCTSILHSYSYTIPCKPCICARWFSHVTKLWIFFSSYIPYLLSHSVDKSGAYGFRIFFSRRSHCFQFLSYDFMSNSNALRTQTHFWSILSILVKTKESREKESIFIRSTGGPKNCL